MEIIFNCPHCEQELAVDSAGAGSEIQCPSCGEKITIPNKPPEAASGALRRTPAVHTRQSHRLVRRRQNRNASQGARARQAGRIPGEKGGAAWRPRPGARTKKSASGRFATPSASKRGHDKFDERVTEFLNEVGEANIVGIHTINYKHFDVGTQKILTDYGVVVVYRG